MGKILITGACGQIGSDLVLRLQEIFGRSYIIPTDIKEPIGLLERPKNFHYLDVLDQDKLDTIVTRYEVESIFHMAAILSALGERNPQLAYKVNMQGLINVLEVARRNHVKKVLMPSSIAVFGPDAQVENTPNYTPLNPTTMYGVTKVAGEKLLQYYFKKYGIDTRSIRYPGIISSETEPGGGTTDYAVDLYVEAVLGKSYTCYIKAETALPFMYMPDAIKAIIDLYNADLQKLSSRVYNVGAMSLTPIDLINSIQKYIPEFNCSFKPDYRQKIAESWPHSIDDSLAQNDWGWKPDYNLDAMTKDMIARLKKRVPLNNND
jgi:nucleoside-diphosphate-sugar epimerase